MSAPLYEFIKDVKSSLRAKVRSRPFSVQKRAGLEALRTARLETMSQFTSMTDQPKSVKVVAKTGDDLTVTKARAAKSPKRRQRAIVQVNSRHCTRALAWDSKAREFAGKHNLLLVLNDIYEIALKCFRISGMPVVKYEVDPEDGGEYLVISAKVIGSVDDALESNDRFIDAALARYGLEALRLVRFLYAIM